MIELRTGTKIWLAAGVTDMRRGFDRLSAQVQTVLEQQPFSGHVFLFRGRRGDIVKPVSYTHLDVYKRQGYQVVAVKEEPGL